MNEVILINSDAMGAPDEKLGRILSGNFLRLLGERETLPEYIILLNGGLRLATRGSDTLEHLQYLEQRGVKIVICRTCVDYFDIESEIAVGQIDGMVRIIDILSSYNVLTV